MTNKHFSMNVCMQKANCKSHLDKYNTFTTELDKLSPARISIFSPFYVYQYKYIN